MPFRSKAQQRYLFSKHPRMAKKWAGEMKKGAIKRLPERKGRKR